MAVIDTGFWCKRVRTCFTTFVKNPSTLQHLLLFGPPGSGKTTSANWLVSQIWKGQKSLMCISMNAADERSLEAIRQKIFPFLRASWSALDMTAHTTSKPRFIILDECETLTEAAQLSLQTVLDKSPQEVCVILICNSQSRIHPKLRQRLLRIRYDPPVTTSHSNDLFHEITRGDLRFNGRREPLDQRAWFYLHHHPEQIRLFLQTTNTDMFTILTELLLISNFFCIMDKELLDKINTVMPLLNANIQMNLQLEIIESAIRLFKLKFEVSIQ
jgi:hypothetical protein